ncbi:MAG: TolC family protein [Chthoniobacterales bacterium]|nr:TolC family protein [Chthoniobacterales bacterium]
MKSDDICVCTYCLRKTSRSTQQPFVFPVSAGDWLEIFGIISKSLRLGFYCCVLLLTVSLSFAVAGETSFLISSPTLTSNEETNIASPNATMNQTALSADPISSNTNILSLPIPPATQHNLPLDPTIATAPRPNTNLISSNTVVSAELTVAAPSPSITTKPTPALGTNSIFFEQDLEKKGGTIPASTKALMDAGTKIQSGVVAPQAPRLTIDECVKTALQKNPSVLIAIDTIRQQSGNFITVRSAIIPQLGVTNATYSWIDPALNNTSGLPGNQVPINQSWGLQLGGTQLLYNGGTAIANIKAAKFSEQIAYYNLRVTIDSVIAQIISAFYQVVLNRALVVANQQSVELLASQVEDQKSRFDAGTVPRFNVLQAEVQLANAQPALITARNNLRISLFQLVQLIGMNYPNLNSVEVPFEVVGELVYQPRKINVDESIHTALQRSPTLKSQRHNILMMAQNITAALGGYLPTVTAGGGYQYLSVDSSYTNNSGTTLFNHNISNFVSGWFFGVQGNWAIFDGLATYGNVKQAKANLMIAKTAYDNGVRQVILNVQQAISNMQQAKETVDSQKANVLQAAEALRLAQERLNAGAGVQLDILNAQVQLLKAQTTVLQSEYNYIAYTAQYDQALSLNTQYEELFDDPMNHREKGRYKILNSSKNPQPLLPRSLRASDPLPTEFTASKPIKRRSQQHPN